MRHAWFVIAVLAVVACKNDAAATRDESGAVPADNTGKNERDRARAEVTAQDQSDSESDRKITQEIRQSVMQQEQLSGAAKNVKIITANGVVTLRGPVKSEQERTDIVALANKVAGIKKLENRLELAPN